MGRLLCGSLLGRYPGKFAALDQHANKPVNIRFPAGHAVGSAESGRWPGPVRARPWSAVQGVAVQWLAVEWLYPPAE